jgi:hypothetical protein
MSRIALAPELTSTMEVWAIAIRSADSSKLSAAPWWTPPSPPVANTSIPAVRARNAVAAMVVPALAPVTAAMASSRMLAFMTVSSCPSSAIWSGDRPTVGVPRCTPIVAGTPPASRMIRSPASATSTLRGLGRPWVKIVDSSATTGVPADSASSTSAATDRRGDGVMRAPRRLGSAPRLWPSTASRHRRLPTCPTPPAGDPARSQPAQSPDEVSLTSTLSRRGPGCQTRGHPSP